MTSAYCRNWKKFRWDFSQADTEHWIPITPHTTATQENRAPGFKDGCWPAPTFSEMVATSRPQVAKDCTADIRGQDARVAASTGRDRAAA